MLLRHPEMDEHYAKAQATHFNLLLSFRTKRLCKGSGLQQACSQSTEQLVGKSVARSPRRLHRFHSTGFWILGCRLGS